jgi:hypothetical protein
MTENNKADTAAVSTFADHEVILPPNKLKKAVVRLRPGTHIDFDPVARAEAALAELASEFSTWMEHECSRLDEARMVVRARGFDTGTRDALCRARHQGTGRDVRIPAGRAGRREPVPAAGAHARAGAHPDRAR